MSSSTSHSSSAVHAIATNLIQTTLISALGNDTNVDAPTAHLPARHPTLVSEDNVYEFAMLMWSVSV